LILERETDMKYENTLRARFIERPNRFIARVELKGRVETVHVKNTGRCRELLLPGSEVVLLPAGNPVRKTRYDLVAVRKEGLGWVNIDSQAPNAAVREWLEKNPPPFAGITRLRPEYPFGAGRADFYIEQGDRKILMEVKGCTLEIGGLGYFPDAPTERGVRHLQELAEAVGRGYECYIAFVVAMPGARAVRPFAEAHPPFGQALEAALRAGVRQLTLPCRVGPDELVIEEAILSP